MTYERRIAGVAERIGIPLEPPAILALLRHGELVLTWNRILNLTGAADLPTLIDRHLADSLCVLTACELATGCVVADVGSGAGFPGIPIAVVRPDLAVTLIEATRKKVAFLEHVRDALHLTNLRVLWGRAEHLAHQADLRGAFDVVVTRATAAMAVAAELCLPFCRVGGVGVFVKGPAVDAELAAAGEHIDRLGAAVESSRVFTLPPEGRRTVVVVVRKHVETPDGFPRRTLTRLRSGGRGLRRPS